VKFQRTSFSVRVSAYERTSFSVRVSAYEFQRTSVRAYERTSFSVRANVTLRSPCGDENCVVVACRRRLSTVVLRGRVSSRASDVAFGPFTVAAVSSTRIRFVSPVAISAGDHTPG
jgi:hypothetical protein